MAPSQRDEVPSEPLAMGYAICRQRGGFPIFLDVFLWKSSHAKRQPNRALMGISEQRDMHEHRSSEVAGGKTS